MSTETRRFTILVCSTCGGELKGRTCVNGHSSYPSERLEVVPAVDYDDAVKLASAAIDALPEPGRTQVIEAMKERVA